MVNRQQRRALARAAKKTHKLEPHVCVLWVPIARGYFSHFTEQGFAVTDEPQHAQRFCEHYASTVAVSLFDRHGARAIVRPCLSSVSLGQPAARDAGINQPALVP